MNQTIQPISDDDLADRAIELFLAGYEPMLFARDLGLTPEQVYDQIRWTLQLYIDKALAAQTKLSRKGTGRPRKADALSAAQRSKKWREKQKQKVQKQ